MTVRDRASDMTIELDSVAANAPDNAEGATVRTARYAINAAHASGNITGEQHAEARDVGEESGMINAEAMNSVTEKKRRRRSILTKDVMAGIPVLVQQGLNAEAIAARLGCTAGTLKVRCSQAQHQPARTQRGQGGAAWCRWSQRPRRPSRQSRSGPMPLPCRPHCNSAELRCPGCASGRKQPA